MLNLCFFGIPFILKAQKFPCMLTRKFFDDIMKYIDIEGGEGIMKYTGKNTKEISFPIGGIGTGSIGIGGDGRLIDWEIFQRPSKGSINSYTHFAIRIIQDGKIKAAVLNGNILKDYAGQYSKEKFMGYGFGPNTRKMYGFPHFENVEFDGEFPIANISFKDTKFPANVKMTAFNPFIPSDDKNSSIPAGFFEIEIENTTESPAIYEVAFSAANPFEKSLNTSDINGKFKTLSLLNSGDSPDSTSYGDITAATDCDIAYAQTYWYRGGWQDGIVAFWNDFSGETTIKDRVYPDAGSKDIGTLFARINLKTHEKKKVRFVISWNIPNNYNYWDECRDEVGNQITWKNYYAVLFENSMQSAEYSLKNWDDLYNRTLKFKNAIHSSSLQKPIIDAVTSNLSVLKSPTVLRLEDGTFYGWEGVDEQEGSCEGTCQHVWNYAYALCFLFPKLERSIRDAEFKYCTDKNGRMAFRMRLPLGREINSFRACVDGQMGAVIKTYREWKISGDNEWLKEKWESVKKILEYAWSDENPDRWDFDKDGVLEGRQHHTLDMELFGPSSWLEGMYLAALKAASKMAEFLGETDKASEYLNLFKRGFDWTKENLFNGKYFIQKVDLYNKKILEKFDASETYWNSETHQLKYQIGEGSSIDQLLAQWHADIIGLGDIFDKEQISVALMNMMQNNFKESMRDFVNPWRIFSVNDEAGSVICDYPEGTEKPKTPIPYCEETMTGFEYSFGGLLISREKMKDGLKVVKAVRDRFDGEKRNPWNEFECGSNYARSMASYALLPIACGFNFDMPKKHIGFNPYITDAFRCFWSLDGAWGVFEISGNIVTLEIYEGALLLSSIGLKFCNFVTHTKIDGKDMEFKFNNGILSFNETKITKEVKITYEKS